MQHNISKPVLKNNSSTTDQVGRFASKLHDLSVKRDLAILEGHASCEILPLLQPDLVQFIYKTKCGNLWTTARRTFSKMISYAFGNDSIFSNISETHMRIQLQALLAVAQGTTA
jgi:hypothetical protein